MKTTISKVNLSKALLLGALTIAPALALTNTAQAAPDHRVPTLSRNNAPTWNNGRNDVTRNNSQVDDHRTAPAPLYQAPRYQAPRFDNQRFDAHDNVRFDSRRDYDYNRNYNGNHDYNRNHNNGSDTGKIIGAGIVGAILGAVLSR